MIMHSGNDNDKKSSNNGNMSVRLVMVITTIWMFMLRSEHWLKLNIRWSKSC